MNETSALAYRKSSRFNMSAEQAYIKYFSQCLSICAEKPDFSKPSIGPTGGISLKIRGKINLLVFVMAGAALVIGATGLYAMRQYDQQLQVYEQVAERAHLGERLNRYVTAVVMEARGIYAADTSKTAKPFADGLMNDLDEIDKVVASWAPLVPDGQKSAFNSLVDRSKEFRGFRTETARLGTTDGPDAAGKQGNNDANRANRKAFQAEIDAVMHPRPGDWATYNGRRDGNHYNPLAQINVRNVKQLQPQWTFVPGGVGLEGEPLRERPFRGQRPRSLARGLLVDCW